MLQLSKKVEYGLMALRHMAMNPRGQVFTAKEIAAKYDIPYELLAKVLQKLTRAGLVVSTQGMHGGYSLAKQPNELHISNIISVIEDEKPTIAECYAEGGEDCSIFQACTIRKPLGKMQHNLNLLLENTTLEQIV
ncbi:MAG: Rrf2 family transcriptional regulator [Ignavibacteriales bacterium]|nr:Rrf2 family transcriptional regulator [Ignavibacteriales bacterium]